MRGGGLRKIEGAVALATLVFFFAHETAGVLFVHEIVSGETSWLAWAGILGIAFHVGLSIATSRQMLNDEERPPSPRKKRHLARKWVTGAAIMALAAGHALACHGTPSWQLLTALSAMALAVHVCVAAKSLVSDLGLPQQAKAALRTAVIIATAFLIAAL